MDGMVRTVYLNVLQDAGIHVTTNMEDVSLVNLDTQETSVRKVYKTILKIEFIISYALSLI